MLFSSSIFTWTKDAVYPHTTHAQIHMKCETRTKIDAQRWWWWWKDFYFSFFSFIHSATMVESETFGVAYQSDETDPKQKWNKQAKYEMLCNNSIHFIILLCVSVSSTRRTIFREEKSTSAICPPFFFCVSVATNDIFIRNNVNARLILHSEFQPKMTMQ